MIELSEFMDSLLRVIDTWCGVVPQHRRITIRSIWGSMLRNRYAEVRRERDHEWHTEAARAFEGVQEVRDLERVFGLGNLHQAVVHELWKRHPRVAPTLERARAAEARLADLVRFRPLSDYVEELGPVLWWLVPVVEPPCYLGCRGDDDWPWPYDGEPTNLRWTPIPLLISDGSEVL